jgi:hypothetical protein
LNRLYRYTLPAAIALAFSQAWAAPEVPAAAAPLSVESFFQRAAVESMQLSPSGR